MLLSELLPPERIRIPLAGASKDDLLRELVDVLHAAGEVGDPSEVLHAVREREAVLSTGIGNGVAIPHGKSAQVSALAMAAGVVREPVDFEALDGRPVSLFFLLVGPESAAGRPRQGAEPHLAPGAQRRLPRAPGRGRLARRVPRDPGRSGAVVSRRLLAWLPALAWAAAIFAVSSRGSVGIPAFPGADKVLHFAAYALFGFLLAYGAAASGLAPRWGVALGWAYGASDEVHQAFVPGRSADPADWAADALGVLAGTFAYARLRAWRRGRARTPAMAGTDR